LIRLLRKLLATLEPEDTAQAGRTRQKGKAP
jgi:hypothetical protein